MPSSGGSAPRFRRVDGVHSPTPNASTHATPEAALPSDPPLVGYLDRVLAEALGSALVTDGPTSPQEVWALGPELAHAADLVDVENIELGSTRMRRFKRTVVRLNRPQMHRQTALNRALVGVVGQLTSHVAGLVSAQEQHRTAMAARLADLRVRLRLLESGMERLDALMRQLEDHVQLRAGETSEHLERIALEHRSVIASIERVSRELRELPESPAGPSDDARRARLDTVYERFEDEFRGGPDEIRSRLEVYLADVGPLHGGPHAVVDVGSGRGEWLELLRDSGIPAFGIDANVAMVERCRSAGLDVRSGDAVSVLSSLAPASVGAVTSFHVVEHLRLVDLVALLDAARQALVAGGTLILETPNSTNLLVGASTFYRDPTHVRPLHPDLLRFLVEQAGFVDVETRFLHPVGDAAATPAEADPASDAFSADLHWALRGPQDFAVVAHAPAG